MVELWEIDPTRYRFVSAAEFGYVREILVHRMLRVWGVERGAISGFPHSIGTIAGDRSAVNQR